MTLPNICWSLEAVRALDYRVGNAPMRDMRKHLEKLRADAAECALIRDLATDPAKRELFTRLAEHLSTLAREVEVAIAARLGDDDAQA
jgi:hypothetical protein